MNRIRTLLVALWALCSCAMAQVSDSVEVSLLTCSPGTEAYQLYGHTAVRVRDLRGGVDAVFNYGVFNFRAPHFVWRFMLGECDYEVLGYPFELFMEEYAERGSSVREQVLNLSPGEALRLAMALAENSRPENRTYRYNFLSNNCTTKSRDIIEQNLDGHVVYGPSAEHRTYRELLHELTAESPWSEVGNDLLLGAACDTLLSDRAQQFLPGQLADYVAEAQVFDSLDNRRPLVRRDALLLAESRPAAQPEPMLTPLQLGAVVFVLALFFMLVEYRTRRMFWGLDVLLMTMQGIMGLLLWFMFFCSEHPTVDTNWQVWPFNPLPLLFIPWVVRCARRRQVCPYHYVNLLVLALFVLLMPWIPQQFSALTLPLALVLLTRPVSYLINYNRR